VWGTTEPGRPCVGAGPGAQRQEWAVRAATREVKVGNCLHRTANLPSLTNAPNGIMPRTITWRPSFRLTSFGPLYAPKAFAGVMAKAKVVVFLGTEPFGCGS